MTGDLYIDGKDAYTVYGVYILEGGYNELIAMPPLKSIETNDWQEEDGIEADLSDPVLNTRDIQIQIASDNYNNRYFSLIERLSDGSYHTFDVRNIGRVYRLRLVSVTPSSSVGDFALMTLKFADDFPLNDYQYAAPVGSLSSDDSYTIDGRPTTDYDVRILQGSLSEITKTPEVKANMLRNIKMAQGAIYDPHTVTYKSKDIKLYCLMTSKDTETLWHNWDALLYDLVRPDERLLWVDCIEQEFPCFYKSCSVSEFYCEGKIWLKFTLTLTLTHEFRISDDDIVLASEDGITVFTQNNMYAIEMLEDWYTQKTFRFVNSEQSLRLSSDGNFRFND